MSEQIKQNIVLAGLIVIGTIFIIKLDELAEHARTIHKWRKIDRRKGY